MTTNRVFSIACVVILLMPLAGNLHTIVTNQNPGWQWLNYLAVILTMFLITIFTRKAIRND